MKDLEFSKYTSNLDGVVLVDADQEKFHLVVDESFLRKLDQLLLDRDRRRAQKPAPKVVEAVEPAPRLDPVPRNPAEAISAVRGWYPGTDRMTSQTSVEEALILNLKSRMIQLPPLIFDESWASEKRKGGGWIVSFSFLLAGQARVAEWIVDDVKREVRAGNSLAEELQVYDSAKAKASQADKGKARLGRRRRA
ncbi:MAG: hypothetical protein DCC49_00960 [Acidobacteria bacterium]|nr:MAG: hypothetical protein DCC49_00960 [Acidobacteriota bacterium]